MHEYNFEVETKESGQRREYGDSYYHYIVTSSRPEYEVKLFCMNVLKKSYEEEKMPDAFAGKLTKFEKLTNNKKNSFDSACESYEYKCEYLCTC